MTDTTTRPVCGRADGETTRGREIRIHLDGRAVLAYEGESVAAALLADGVYVFRRTARRGEARAPHCGVGICFDCVMTVDGRPNVRTCQVPVRDGMQLSTQTGEGEWRLDADVAHEL